MVICKILFFEGGIGRLAKGLEGDQRCLWRYSGKSQKNSLSSAFDCLAIGEKLSPMLRDQG